MDIRGRGSELARLTEAVDRTLGGRGGMVLLSGEAGIGKSRLAAEALQYARSKGCAVLSGQAHPLHSGLAYAPIVEALRPHLSGGADLGPLMTGARTLPVTDPELERTRMFEEVARLVGELAPAVLFVDDLHWADRGTIELVHYIGHVGQVLVLAAYRPSDVLAELSAGARREDNEIRLTPLADNDVATLVQDLLGEVPPERMLQGVTARAKGIPLFVTALVHDGASSLRPDTLPVIVRDVVLSRLLQLNEDERRLLEIVSVADVASNALLAALWDGPLDATLRKLIAARLIVEQGTSYRIAHPLYAEVAYAELTLGERRTLHAAIARTIDAQTPGDVLALAPHYREAGDLVDAARAAKVTAEAGWRAMAVHDVAEAITYMTAAVANSPEDPVLLEGLGLAYQAAGQLSNAEAVWTKASALASGTLLSNLHYRLALLASENGNPAPDVEFAAGDPNGAMLKMIFTLRRTQVSSTQAMIDELRSFATDPTTAGQAVGAYGDALQAVSEYDISRALAAATRVLGLAQMCGRSDSPMQMQAARRLLLWLCIAAGDIPAALEHATRVRTELAQLDVPSASASVQFSYVTANYVRGDLRTALRASDEGIRIARGGQLFRSLTRMLLGRSIVLAEQGRLGEADECRTEAEGISVAQDISVSTLTALADMATSIHSGRTGQVAATPEWVSYNEPLSCVEPLFAGLILVARRDFDALGSTIAHLERFRGAPFFATIADRLTGLRDSSAELLERAADAFTRMGAGLIAAQTRLEWAELTGDRTRVLELVEAFDRQEAAPWAARARKHARSMGIRVPSSRISGVLSTRELEVVRLLGDGLSNADIAARLFLSPRTVETHLRNSYAKLNLSSRVALARWAADNGGRQ
ncbi:AAA family ATPase [Actinocrispum sp. NPDC049592]|uniref:ATP-binding protein n=1 Tax=Actinocrispum sp. NPDC049592 TaxID=3154835 RepID=UPI003414F9F8